MSTSNIDQPISLEAAHAASGEQVRMALRIMSGAIAEVNPDPVALARSVEALATARDPVICTGVGKSGFIMAKMTATLNSLGIRAVYLNPTDALHGDLGIVVPGSVVVVMSNGGNTDELRRLIPTLKSRHCTVIAIVGRADSAIGREASIVVDYGKVTEIDANGLAPTTSTVVQLAVVDALAASASRRRGFTADDFYANHPAGLLGKRFMPVEALMRGRDRVPSVTADCPLTEVMTAMTTHRIGCAAVVNDDGILVGLVTDGDIRRAIVQRVDLYASCAHDIIQFNPQVAIEGDLLQSLVEADGFFGKHFTVPVLDADRRFIGILVSIDLI